MTTLNGSLLAAMLASAACRLDRQKDEINRLNVFPVPDGDTGINMALTLRPLMTKSEKPDAASVAQDAAGMMLRAARGNSGAILSLFFRGMAKTFSGKTEVSVADFAAAFSSGTAEAYRAVSNPTEGTILTVMRLTSEEATAIAPRHDGDFPGFFRALTDVAERALARTPELLPVLRQAHVVDAGGAGFVAVMHGMTAAVMGEPETAAEDAAPAVQSTAAFDEFETEDIRFAYCTECIVEKSEAYLGDGMADAFRDTISPIGDSMVFIEDEAIIKVHIHSNDPGAILSAAIRYGTLVTVKVENMKKQHSELLNESAPARQYSFVSVAIGDGITAAFRDFGCDRIVSGGQSMNPSTEDILSAIRATSGKCVFVLPNNKNIFMVAKEAASLTENRTVIVLPTRSVSEGLCAMMNFDPEASPEDNEAVMTEALKTVTSYSVTHAARDSEIDGLSIREGQYLGLQNGKIVSASDTLDECLGALADTMQSAAFLTVFAGEDATEEDAALCEKLLSERVPGAEVSVAKGGQPLYDFFISAE